MQKAADGLDALEHALESGHGERIYASGFADGELAVCTSMSLERLRRLQAS